jgi:hypothetical protein
VSFQFLEPYVNPQGWYNLKHIKHQRKATIFLGTRGQRLAKLSGQEEKKNPRKESQTGGPWLCEKSAQVSGWPLHLEDTKQVNSILQLKWTQDLRCQASQSRVYILSLAKLIAKKKKKQQQQISPHSGTITEFRLYNVAIVTSRIQLKITQIWRTRKTWIIF